LIDISQLFSNEPRKAFTRRAHTLLLLILIVQLIIGAVAIVQKPLYEYQTDEEGHLNTARFVAEQHRLPGADDLQWNHATLQYSQPPMYYFVAAPLIWLLDDGTPIPGEPVPLPICEDYNTNLTTWARPRTFNIADSGAVRTGYALRLTQLTIAIATTILIYVAALKFSPRAYGQALAAAAMFAFMPSLVSTVAFIGNDVLVMFWGALGLTIFASRRTQTRLSQRAVTFGLLVLVVALATLSKTTGWAMFVLPALVPLQILTSARNGRRLGVLLIGLLALVAIGVAFFNYQTYGSVIGRYPIEALGANQDFWSILRPMLIELWGSLSLTENLSANAVPGLARIQLISCLVVAVGFVILPIQWIRSHRVKEATYAPLFLLGASVALLFIRNLSTINELYVFAPFRYLGPAIPALMLLAAAGLASLPGVLRPIGLLAVPVTWVMLTLLLNTMSPEAVVQRNAVVANNQLPDNATAIEANQAGSEIKVVGYQMVPNDTFDNGTIRLTLYLLTETAPDQMLTLELTAGNTACRLLPVRGFRPSTSFHPGEMVATEVELPYCDDAVNEPVEVNLDWRTVGNGQPSREEEGSALTLFTIPGGLVTRASQCLENLGEFNDQFQIIKATIPPVIKTPGSLLLSVNWLTKTSTDQSYIRVYSLRDQHNNEIARCEGVPRQDTYPTNRWREGEIIYDDRCEMQVSELPAGETYSIWIGLRNPDDGSYLPHDQNEDPDFVRLGTTTVP
jgi:hypothetical protein